MLTRLPVVFRGYDRTMVDDLLRRTEPALFTDRETVRASARQALRSAAFPRRLRGYARRRVRHLVAQRLAALSDDRD